jgi:hypothetical protein
MEAGQTLGTSPRRHLAMADWLIAGAALFIIINGLSICIGWPRLLLLRSVLAELTVATPP